MHVISQKPKVIHKFPLELEETQQVEFPIGSSLLTVQMQNGKPCIWALVIPEAEKTVLTVNMYGTGQEVDHNNQQYIGTVQDGSFVWHIFVKI